MNGHGYPSPHSDKDPYTNGLSIDTHEENGVYRPVPQRSPLTKQVNQLAYEIPKNKYANPWSYAPEFLKVFGDVRIHVGGRAVFDSVLLGSPRPKVFWLFNGEKMRFNDVVVEDTADLCRLVIPHVQPYHYGYYTVICENEVGRAIANASLLPE